MLSNSHDFVRPADEAERAYLESLVRDDYERSHPGDTFDAMKARRSFSKEDKGLYRDWLALAAMRAEAARMAKRQLKAAWVAGKRRYQRRTLLHGWPPSRPPKDGGPKPASRKATEAVFSSEQPRRFRRYRLGP